DRAGRPDADARRRRRGQRPRRRLLRRPPRRHEPRRAAPHRPGRQPRQGTVQRRSGTGGHGVVKAAGPDRRPPAPPSPKPPSSRLHSVLALLPVTAGLLLLAGVVLLGWLA